MIRTFRKLSSALVVALAMALVGCDSMIYEDLTDCPQEVTFHMFRQTPCDGTVRYYPQEIKDVHIFAFDQTNTLVRKFSASNLVLTPDYRLTVPFDIQGKFTFVAWGSDSIDCYKTSDFTEGVTTKSELIESLTHPAGRVDEMPSRLFFGQYGDSLTRDYKAKSGSHLDTLGLNMLEYTYRLTVNIYGLDSTKTYKVYITDNNDAYDFDGHMLTGRPEFAYNAEPDRYGTLLSSSFTTLQLTEGGNSRLIVYNETDDKEVYNAKLVDDLIMFRGGRTLPPYSLDCKHDFNIHLWLEKDPVVTTDTYMVVRAIIDDWNVITRSVTPRG